MKVTMFDLICIEGNILLNLRISILFFVCQKMYAFFCVTVAWLNPACIKLLKKVCRMGSRGSRFFLFHLHTSLYLRLGVSLNLFDTLARGKGVNINITFYLHLFLFFNIGARFKYSFKCSILFLF